MSVAEDDGPESAYDPTLPGDKSFRAIWELARDAMALSDRRGIVLAANRAYLQLYGYSAEEIIGRNFAVIFPEGAREWANEEYRKIFADPKIAPAVEAQIRRKDGTERVVESRYTFLTEGNQRSAMVSIIRDITDIRQAEAELRASQETFRSAFTYSPIGMALLGLDGRYLRANPAFCTFSGYTEPELKALSFQTLSHPDDLPADLERLSELISGERNSYSTEKRYIRKGGGVVWALLNVSLVRDSEGNPLHYIRQIQDITERKMAEAALRESEAKLRSLVAGNIIGILRADIEHIVEANDSFLQTIGYTRQDLEEGKLNWRAMTPPEWAPLDERALEEMVEEGACRPFEKEYFRKDGERVPILIGAALLTRSPLSWMCFVLDLTQLKRTQANEREARLQAEHAVIDRDRLLSIVAHDLRNPLTAVQGTAQMLARWLGQKKDLDRERLRDMIAQIESSAMRMNSLIMDILDFSKLQAGVPLSFDNHLADLVQLLQQVVDECRKSNRSHEIHFDSALPQLVGQWDKSRLERVFFNLLDNAVKYSPQDGMIKVEIVTAPAEPHEAVPGWVRVKIIDRGIGIPASDLPHIFEWYKRASNADEWAGGTGIGLAGAQQVVRLYGGSITVQSVEGEGSTFTVTLPLPASLP